MVAVKQFGRSLAVKKTIEIPKRCFGLNDVAETHRESKWCDPADEKNPRKGAPSKQKFNEEQQTR